MARDTYDDTPRPRRGVSLAKGPVAIIGIATVIIVIFYVLIVGSWDDEPEGDEGGEEAAIAFVVD